MFRLDRIESDVTVTGEDGAPSSARPRGRPAATVGDGRRRGADRPAAGRRRPGRLGRRPCRPRGGRGVAAGRLGRAGRPGHQPRRLPVLRPRASSTTPRCSARPSCGPRWSTGWKTYAEAERRRAPGPPAGPHPLGGRARRPPGRRRVRPVRLHPGRARRRPGAAVPVRAPPLHARHADRRRHRRRPGVDPLRRVLRPAAAAHAGRGPGPAGRGPDGAGHLRWRRRRAAGAGARQAGRGHGRRRRPGGRGRARARRRGPALRTLRDGRRRLPPGRDRLLLLRPRRAGPAGHRPLRGVLGRRPVVRVGLVPPGRRRAAVPGRPHRRRRPAGHHVRARRKARRSSPPTGPTPATPGSPSTSTRRPAGWPSSTRSRRWRRSTVAGCGSRWWPASPRGSNGCSCASAPGPRWSAATRAGRPRPHADCSPVTRGSLVGRCPSKTTPSSPRPPAQSTSGEPPEVETKPSGLRNAVEWVLIAGGALLVAFVIKTFLLQAFYIPSLSMAPTLKINDRVLVNKLSYDLHDVRRGDLVVFESPPNEGSATKDLIKRVIGLPGETVEARDGHILINGQVLDEPYLERDVETRGPMCQNETLPGLRRPGQDRRPDGPVLRPGRQPGQLPGQPVHRGHPRIADHRPGLRPGLAGHRHRPVVAGGGGVGPRHASRGDRGDRQRRDQPGAAAGRRPGGDVDRRPGPAPARPGLATRWSGWRPTSAGTTSTAPSPAPTPWSTWHG